MAKGVKTGGRQAGTPNKTNAALKDAILNAFTTVGGEDYLVMVAKEDMRTFCSLLGRVLPTTLSGDKDNPLKLEASIARDSVIGLLERIAAGRSGDDGGPCQVAGPREG